jgi:hypothetical protein
MALSNYYRFGPNINYGSSLSDSNPPAVVGVSGGRLETPCDLWELDDGG